jgi:iron-sulfur cluster assembly accessory protein
MLSGKRRPREASGRQAKGARVWVIQSGRQNGGLCHTVLILYDEKPMKDMEIPQMDLKLPADSPAPLPATGPRVTDRAFARLAEIEEMTGARKPLRVAVSGGGCSGFQYDIRLDDAAPDDLVMERDGQRVLVDPVSLPFLQNAVIDFTEELIGARFVIDNPDASSSCGCGTSFSF